MEEGGHISGQEEAYETPVEEERQEENQPSMDKARMEVLLAVPRYHTTRCKGVVLGQRDLVLVDGGAKNNFIDAYIVEKINYQVNHSMASQLSFQVTTHGFQSCKSP